MEIKLDDVKFHEVFTAAIMQTLDENKRNELIKGAIQALMSKKNDSYSSKTMLQDAFEWALRDVAQQQIKDFLSTDKTVTDAITNLIKDAVTKITTDSRDKTVSKIAEQIISGLYDKSY